MTIGVSGRRDVREVTEIAKYQIQEILQTVPGVGAVFMSGGRSRAINVIVDTDRLASYALSIDDVRQALIEQNLEVPGGLVDQGSRELVLRTLGRIESPEQVQRPDRRQSQRLPDPHSRRRPGRGFGRRAAEPVPARRRERRQPVHSKAVGDEHDSGLRRGSGPPREAQARPAARHSHRDDSGSGAVRAQLDARGEVPPAAGRRAGVADDSAVHSRLADDADRDAWRFRRRSCRRSCSCTRWAFTLNNITMLGLILAIGIVIDDAVVVHENIFRHMEEGGLDAMSAARKGTREIVLAVLATSLSLVVIFVPVAFMGGLVGRFFRSFGLTVAFAVLMSLFVSFTLTPMLCAHFLKLDPDEAGHGKIEVGLDLSADRRIYGRMLGWSLRHRLVSGRGLPACRRLDGAAGDGARGQPGAARRSERVSDLDPHAGRLHARSQRSASRRRSRNGWPSCRASSAAVHDDRPKDGSRRKGT